MNENNFPENLRLIVNECIEKNVGYWDSPVTFIFTDLEKLKSIVLCYYTYDTFFRNLSYFKFSRKKDRKKCLLSITNENFTEDGTSNITSNKRQRISRSKNYNKKIQFDIDSLAIVSNEPLRNIERIQKFLRIIKKFNLNFYNKHSEDINKIIVNSSSNIAKIFLNDFDSTIVSD